MMWIIRNTCQPSGLLQIQVLVFFSPSSSFPKNLFFTSPFRKNSVTSSNRFNRVRIKFIANMSSLLLLAAQRKARGLTSHKSNRKRKIIFFDSRECDAIFPHSPNVHFLRATMKEENKIIKFGSILAYSSFFSLTQSRLC